MRIYEEDPCGGENINIHSQEEEEEEEEDNSSIISQHFSRLSSMLPGLQQDTIIDQDDIIQTAIEHIEKLRHDKDNLQERVNRYKANIQERVNGSINAIRSSVDNAVSTAYMPGSSSGQENNGIPIVKVICKGNSVLIKIHCKEEKGNMSRITNEIDKFNLSIVTMYSFPFDDHIDITFIAKVRDGLSVNLKEFVSTFGVLLSD